VLSDDLERWDDGGVEKTSCGYKGFIVLTQIAMELVINNTLLSQKVDV